MRDRDSDDALQEQRRLEEAAQWLLELDHRVETDRFHDGPPAWQRWYQGDARAAALDEMTSFIKEVKACEPPRMATPEEQSRDSYDASVSVAEWHAQRTRQQLRPLSHYRRMNWVIGLAAAIGLLAIGVLMHTAWRSAAPSEGIGLYETAAGRNREIVLSDGSRITLGARSAITTNYTEQRRVVVLEHGEALFTVARDATRPFIVLAGSGSIKALGTAFNVLREIDRVVVTVSDGTVVVAPRNPSLTDSHEQTGTSDPVAKWLPVSVRSGQGMSYQESGTASAVETADPKIATAWRDGRLEYLREPLRHVIEDVNRYWHRQIIFDRDTGDLLYTGDVVQSQIDAWAHNLPQIFPVEVSDTDLQHVLIRIRSDAAAGADSSASGNPR